MLALNLQRNKLSSGVFQSQVLVSLRTHTWEGEHLNVL